MNASAVDIQGGRYVCLRTPGLPAAIIRFATRSQFNHVVVTGPGGAIVQASMRDGVIPGHLADYTGCLAVVNDAEPMTSLQRDLVWQKAQSLVGDPYDYPVLVADGLACLGWHWRLLFRACGMARIFDCSQVAAVCGVAAGLRAWLCGQAEADQVTPAMMAARPVMVPVSWQ